MRLRSVLWACLAGLAGSAILRSPALAFATLAAPAIAALVIAARRRLFRGVSFERSVSRRVVPWGGDVEVALSVTNDKLLPLVWLQIRDQWPSGVVAEGFSLRKILVLDRQELVQTVSVRWYERAAAPLPGALRAARRAPVRAGGDAGRRPLRHRRREHRLGGAQGRRRAAPRARRARRGAAARPPAGGGGGRALPRRRPDGAARHAALPAGRLGARRQLAGHGAHRRAAHQRVRPGLTGLGARTARRGLAVPGVGGCRSRAHGAPVRGLGVAGGGVRRARVRGRVRLQRRRRR